MEEENRINANAEIPTTHFFVYKDKQYPFNFDLFKIFSQYFNSSLPIEEKINLSDDNHDLHEDSIPDFINFCQARTIVLTKDNSPTLLRLSRTYKVPSLLAQTKEYISTHKKEVVVEILSVYQNEDIFNLTEYEEIMSKDFVKYVQDDRLLTLPITTLHRIINKYLINYRIVNHSNNPGHPSELIEFLFKCLDHFGREASALFDHIDLFGSKGNLINRLLDSYSEKFDFSFVNTGTLKTVYELENEIIAREKEMKQQNSESKQELMTMSKQLGEQIEVMAKQRQDELGDKKEMFDQIPKMVAQEIEVMRKEHVEEMKKRDEMIDGLVKKFEEVQENYREELRRKSEEFNEKLRKMSDMFQVLMKPRITQLFNESYVGLISILGDDVTISSQKNDHSAINPSYLRKYNDDIFNNNHGADAKSEPDTIIKFDFGSNKRIDLHSYFIRTNSGGTNCPHPKTWRIEGSNDDQSWTKLDSRSNDGSLNGKFNQCYFICKHGSYGSVSNLFKYIRFIQQESWDSSKNYIVRLSYFELYGSVVTI